MNECNLRDARSFAGSRVLARRAGAAIMAAFALIVYASPASAANADVTVTVRPLPGHTVCPLVTDPASCTETIQSGVVVNKGVTVGDVSLKRADFVSLSAQQITIQNNTTNVINQVAFKLTTSVVGTSNVPLAGVTATYKEVVSATTAPVCTADAAGTTVQCSIGQLRGNADPAGSVSSFVLVFYAPASGAVINAAWLADFSMGNSSGTPPSGGLQDSGTTYTNLITFNPVQVSTGFKTYVGSDGGKFSTGTGVALNTDRFAVTIKVPKSGIAEVVEFADTTACPFNYVCFGSGAQFTIPGTFATDDPLVYTLRLDAEQIKAVKPGAKIEQTKLFYRADPTVANPNPQYAEILLCSITGGPSLNTPCIESRQEYKKPAPAGFIGNYNDFVGDFEWVLKLANNGFIRG